MEQAFICPPCHDDIVILYQDESLLVINKPQPLLSTPGKHPSNKDSVITRLQNDFPSAELAHRLDMATSGLMIIALNKKSLREISIQFQNRTIEKTYEAILLGKVEQQGTIEHPLITDWPNRPKQKICTETGKPSITFYERIFYDSTNNTSHVIFRPITGRSHQLRIHSLAIGHPILGCSLYCCNGSDKASQRLMLHASGIRFSHPVSSHILHFESPAPFAANPVTYYSEIQ